MARLRKLGGLVRPGESVDAAVVNRPLRTLDQKVNYLFDVLEATAAGRALVARQVSVSAAVKVGQPVWYNPSLSRYEPAALAAGADADGVFTLAATARVAGVCREKFSDTLADVTLFGLDTIDLTQSAGASAPTGVLYLAATAGRISATRPAVCVPVLHHYGSNLVLVNAELSEALDRHVHRGFALACVPAGRHTPPDHGDSHAVEDGDAGLPGWLPADHPVFEGAAPAGAAFGYNLQTHPALAAAWPPVPESSAYVEWDKTGVGGFLGVPADFVQIDRHGIWWMTDCYGEVPWPVEANTAFPASDSASDSESEGVGGACPPSGVMAVRVWFVRPQYGSGPGVVTSLRSRDERLKVFCAGTEVEAAVGDLELLLRLAFNVDDGATGALAFRNYDDATNTFRRGPVATGLYALGDNVSLEGDATAVVGDTTVHYGNVGVAVETDPTKQLEVQLYRLDGGTVEFYEGVPYTGLPEDRDTEIRGRFRVPDDIPYASPRLRIRLRLLGTVAATLPDLSLTARRIPASATPAGLPLAGAEFAVTLADDMPALSNAYQYADLASEYFAVAAGDTVLFSVARDGASDGYPGAVGVLDAQADVSE